MPTTLTYAESTRLPRVDMWSTSHVRSPDLWLIAGNHPPIDHARQMSDTDIAVPPSRISRKTGRRLGC